MRTQASPGRAGWIFGSFSERDDALALLDDDGPAEPRDELGIGPLRDVFANAFFPGITTPQTRAKYFLFVPAMYKRIEEDTTLRRRPATAIDELEQSLLEGLMRGGDLDGVIGSKFKRVPTIPASSIYWTGMHAWGIRLFSDSRTHYHGWLQTPSRLLHLDQIDEDADHAPPRWLGLPGEPQLLESPDIQLSRAEATFLEARVQALPTRSGRPLLRELLDAPLEPGLFWDSQLIRRNRADLSQQARDAERLSVAHNGAMRLYNTLCARQAGDVVAVEDWLAECEAWSVGHPPDEWREWNLTTFWERVERLPGGREAREATEPFLAPWIALMSGGETLHGAHTSRLVRERERVTKPGRERLSWPFALEGWNREGLGVQPLDYRWRSAARIIRDIQEGLAL
jgi:hypothetical protein